MDDDTESNSRSRGDDPADISVGGEETVESLLEQIIGFRGEIDTDTIYLQLLAAKALLLYRAEKAPVPSRRPMQVTDAGSRGGIARKESLSPERRTEIARQAANKRWNPDDST